MRSASVIVETRWATMILVIPVVAGRRAARRRESVATSRAEKESSKTSTAGRRTRARAMARRWRCPPETFVPPWAMGASSPPSISVTKSRAWAISRASHSSSSVASSRPRRRLEATVPAKRKGFCGTSPSWAHRASGSARRTSVPPTSTRPSEASRSRGRRLTRVVLPEPVEPTTATVCPGPAVKEIPVRTGSSAPG